MKRQNDLEKILKLITLKRKHGESVVSAIDVTLEWLQAFDSNDFEVMVSDSFIVVTPVGAEFPISQSALAVELSSGDIVIDTFGFFGPVVTGEEAANDMHTRSLKTQAKQSA